MTPSMRARVGAVVVWMVGVAPQAAQANNTTQVANIAQSVRQGADKACPTAYPMVFAVDVQGALPSWFSIGSLQDELKELSRSGTKVGAEYAALAASMTSEARRSHARESYGGVFTVTVRHRDRQVQAALHGWCLERYDREIPPAFFIRNPPAAMGPPPPPPPKPRAPPAPVAQKNKGLPAPRDCSAEQALLQRTQNARSAAVWGTAWGTLWSTGALIGYANEDMNQATALGVAGTGLIGYAVALTALSRGTDERSARARLKACEER